MIETSDAGVALNSDNYRNILYPHIWQELKISQNCINAETKGFLPALMCECNHNKHSDNASYEHQNYYKYNDRHTHAPRDEYYHIYYRLVVSETDKVYPNQKVS